LDEAELVGSAQSGDRQAFDELVRRTFVDTFTLARRLTGNEEDARDVVQEAYLRAWKGIGKFRGDAAFSTWLYRITANAAASSVQRGRRHRAEPFADDFEPVDTGAEQMVSQGAESAETLDRIADALDDLPVKLRSVVVLKDVYGLSHEAIAEELGISVSAAKVRLHRARRKLRDVLYEEGVQANAM
jgi:RNA polymerase sigma-70 factor (ECF subfamily)